MDNLKKAIVFSIIVGILTYVVVRVYSIYRYEDIIKRKNIYCSNLGDSLAQLNKSCYCYYEPFASPEGFEGKTQPLCICECIENGTPVKVGIMSPI